MSKFRKTEDQLETLFDKWLFALKNLPRLLERPKALQERIFAKFFKAAEVANFTKEEYAKYIRSENNYYDWDSIFRTAETKGREEGLKKGREEGLKKGREEGIKQNNIDNARRMKHKGFPISDISDITGLTAAEIELL